MNIPLPLEAHSSRDEEPLNSLSLSHSPVWTSYTQKREIELNGVVPVAEANDPLASRVLVRQMSKEKLDGNLRLLTQFRRQPHFPETFEAFLSGSLMHIVCEYVDLTLLHILGSPRFPTEKGVASIPGQAI
jgi:hypothetical protein